MRGTGLDIEISRLFYKTYYIDNNNIVACKECDVNDVIDGACCVT